MKNLMEMDIPQLEKAIKKLKKSEEKFGKDTGRTEKIDIAEKRLAALQAGKEEE
jgi:hypothetical protein